MNGTLKKQIEKNLGLVLSDFKNENEAIEFLKSFLSESEFVNLTKRLSVAYWLANKRSYENIKTNLKVSSATIAEAKNLLKKNEIKHAIKKLDASKWADKWSEKISKMLPPVLKT